MTQASNTWLRKLALLIGGALLACCLMAVTAPQQAQADDPQPTSYVDISCEVTGLILPPEAKTVGETNYDRALITVTLTDDLGNETEVYSCKPNDRLCSGWIDGFTYLPDSTEFNWGRFLYVVYDDYSVTNLPIPGKGDPDNPWWFTATVNGRPCDAQAWFLPNDANDGYKMYIWVSYYYEKWYVSEAGTQQLPTWTVGQDGDGLSFDAGLNSPLTGDVRLDDAEEPLSADLYTVSDDGKRITLKPELLNTLKPGDHVLNYLVKTSTNPADNPLLNRPDQPADDPDNPPANNEGGDGGALAVASVSDESRAAEDADDPSKQTYDQAVSQPFVVKAATPVPPTNNVANQQSTNKRPSSSGVNTSKRSPRTGMDGAPLACVATVLALSAVGTACALRRSRQK